MTNTSVLGAVLATLALFGITMASVVHGQERIRIGISAVSLGFLPTVIAEKKGFYTKYNLAPEHVLVPCANRYECNPC
jgi:ABC-type nitrate/sulfonate/bicarbonate transport system substrate-binding protein